MKTFTTLLQCAAGILLSILAASCSQKDPEGNIVRLGYLQNDLHHLPAFVALERNFFKDEGLEVKVSGVFKAGPEEMSAFGARELDIGYVGQAPATAAVLNGIADVKFIAQVNLEGSSIVVGKDSKAASLADLSGRSVAIPGHATMQDFLLRKAAGSSGTPFEKLRVMVLKPPEMLQALNLKQIDAFIAWEPYPAQARQNGTGRTLLTSAHIWPGHPCCVLVADAELCRRHPETIKKIQAAHRRACGFIGSNQADAVAIGVQYTGMPRETVAAALDGIKYQPELDRDKAGEFVAFLRDLRYIKSQSAEKPLSEPYAFFE